MHQAESKHIYIMHDSSHIGQIHVDVVDILKDFSGWSCHSHVVCLYYKKPASASMGVESAELDHHQIAGDASLYAEFK